MNYVSINNILSKYFITACNIVDEKNNRRYSGHLNLYYYHMI